MKRTAAIPKPPLVKIYSLQCLTLSMVAVVLGINDTTVAYSALLGGLISIGPNAYFARFAFRVSGARAASEITRQFYRGETGKFLLTAALFASTFLLVKPLSAEALFIAYGVMTLINWLVAARLSGRVISNTHTQQQRERE